MVKSTKKHIKYWKERKIDWKKDYQSTADHPHRNLLSAMIRSIPFTSLWEVGVGGGANLIRFVKDTKGKQFGGCDVSEDAIELCRKTFNGAIFHVCSGDDMLMSDKSIDVVLTDMCLIYVDPFKIDKFLNEFRRVGRDYVVLCEFHSTSFWKRLKARLGGYHVYDYRKRLEKLGYFNVQVQPIPEEFWPGADSNTGFRSIITARI